MSLGWAAPIKNLREVVDWFISEYTAGWDLFVFSDDIGWCKENSKALGMHQFKDVCFVEGNGNGKNYIDMQLMSYCKGMILSNSSFSYLAALLNEHEDAILNPTKRYL